MNENFTDLYNKALNFLKFGNLEQAITILKKVLEIDSSFYEAKYNLANIYKLLGRFNEAIELYSQVSKQEPNNYQYYYNLANCFFEIGNYDLAVKNYEEIVKLKPDFYETYYNIGYTYENKGNLKLAIINYEKAIEKNSNYKEIYKKVAICCEEFGKIEKARRYYKKYLSFDPNDIGLKIHLDFVNEIICFSNKVIEYQRSNVEKNVDLYANKITINDLNSFFTNITLFIYHGRNNKEIKKLYASLFENLAIEINPKYEKKTKIRLGFFVSHSQEKLFFRLMKGFLNNFSKDEFEVFIITATLTSQIKLKNLFENEYINYTKAPNDFFDLTKIIKEMSFDIIYYWEIGSSFTSYFLPLFKVAPIQCTSLGWPETTGLKQVDYFISYKFMEIENSQTHYTEKLIKMDNLPLIYERVSILEYYPKDYFEIDSKFNIYLCVQALKKIHPDFDFLIEGILEKDKNGIIFFVEDSYSPISETLQYRFKSKFPELYERVVFLPKLSYQKYLNLINYADVILDTLYFCGGNTSVEAFSIGTPVITLPWELQRGRFTYSLYQMLEIDDCIANSMDNYIDLAVKIACDKNLRNDISKKIKTKNNILFDNSNEAVREMELVFKKMVSEIQIN